MIQTRISADILATGIDQAIRLGAPGEMVARLRGALAFANLRREPSAQKHTAPLVVPAIPPPDSVAVQDE